MYFPQGDGSLDTGVLSAVVLQSNCLAGFLFPSMSSWEYDTRLMLEKCDGEKEQADQTTWILATET